MFPQIFVILTQYLIICSTYKFVSGSPLIGTDTRDVREYEIPFIVAIMRIYNENGVQSVELECTGSIITRQVIMTAAHCVDGVSVLNLKVLAGSIYLEYAVQYNVSWWILYNEWSDLMDMDAPDEQNDLAILHILDAEFPIIPGVLSLFSVADLIPCKLTLIGWELTNENLTHGHIKAATVDIINHDICKEKAVGSEAKIHNFESRFFCTNAETSLLDNGDSGAPILFENQIVGINVGICPSNEDTSRKVNFHLSINYYRHFIDDLCDI